MHKYMAMDRLLLLLSALSAVPLAESTLRASAAAAAANRIMNDGGSADERASRDEHGGLLLDLFSWQNFLTVMDQTDAISSEAPTRSVRHDIDSTIDRIVRRNNHTLTSQRSPSLRSMADPADHRRQVCGGE